MCKVTKQKYSFPSFNHSAILSENFCSQLCSLHRMHPAKSHLISPDTHPLSINIIKEFKQNQDLLTTSYNYAEHKRFHSYGIPTFAILFMLFSVVKGIYRNCICLIYDHMENVNRDQLKLNPQILIIGRVKKYLENFVIGFMLNI